MSCTLAFLLAFLLAFSLTSFRQKTLPTQVYLYQSACVCPYSNSASLKHFYGKNHQNRYSNISHTQYLSLSSSGEWKGVVQVQPWGDCGGLSRCQGPRRGAGHQADPQRPPPWPPSGNPCGGCVHSDRHHLWTHHGAGKAAAFDPSCAWRLSLPALWQVSTIGNVCSYFTSL